MRDLLDRTTDRALIGRLSRPADLSKAELASWAKLCQQNPDLHHPFYSPAFTMAVSRAHPLVFVCVLETILPEARRAAGFLPFQFASTLDRFLRVAEPVGGDMSDYFGLVAEPDLQITPTDLLRYARLASFGYHHLPAAQGRFIHSGGEAVIGHRMIIGDDPAAYWAELKRQRKSFVAESDRRQRKIVEAHGRMRFVFSSDSPLDELRELILRKRAQYATTGVADALAAPWKIRLLEILAKTSDPLCTGVLSHLYAGDTWVASHFGLRNDQLLHYWFPVYNEDLAKLAPGHLLMRQMIERSRELGIRIIDRGAGDQQHKSVYVTETRTFCKGYWHQRSLRGAAARVALSLGWRLKSKLREGQ